MAEHRSHQGSPERDPDTRKLVERFEVDVEQLSDAQVEDLRAKLRELASGVRNLSDQFKSAQLRGHSSHRDNDGWI